MNESPADHALALMLLNSDMQLDIVGLLETDLQVSMVILSWPVFTPSLQRVVFGNRDL